MAEYKCGDCIHAGICEEAETLVGFSRDNPAYCGMFLNSADVAPVRPVTWEWFEKWIPSTTEHPAECEDCGWQCGNCKRALEDMVGGYWDDPYERPQLAYCPNCGCRMDGGN